MRTQASGTLFSGHLGEKKDKILFHLLVWSFVSSPYNHYVWDREEYFDGGG